MKIFLKSVLAFSILILLATLVNQAFDSWRAVIEPRGFRVIRGIVETMVTTPFGDSGLLVWASIAAGSVLLLLLGRVVAAARDRPASTNSIGSQIDPSRTEGSRNRTFGSASRASLPPSGAMPDDLTDFVNLNRDNASRPAWRLVPVGAGTSELATSSSWVGGDPIMPEDVAWPLGRDDRPMLFLAQLDFADLSSTEPAQRPSGVPENGSILFFLDAPGSGDDSWQHSVIVVPENDMDGALRRTAPDGAVVPGDIGWSANSTDKLEFNSVRPEYYLDDDADTPVTKMFGAEVGDPFGFHFPPGFANLFYIEFSPTFGTIGGHWTGMSIACNESDMARGIFNQTQIFGTNMG